MRLIVLDRDGVINENSDEYVKSLAEWVPIPGSLEAIGRLHRAGYKVVVATNQSAVGRGLLSAETLASIHRLMTRAARDQGGEIDEIVFCPHTPGAGCACRKPSPGMLHQIAERFGVSLEGVYFVGDSEGDVLAARQAGARPVLVRTGKGRRTLEQSAEVEGVPVFEDLAGVVEALLGGRLPRL